MVSMGAIVHAFVEPPPPCGRVEMEKLQAKYNQLLADQRAPGEPSKLEELQAHGGGTGLSRVMCRCMDIESYISDI